MFFVPLENFSFIWRSHHYQWTVAFWPMLGTSGHWVKGLDNRDSLYNSSPKSYIMLGTYGHWAVRVLYSVPQLLWHGGPVYNSHLRGPVTLAPICRAFGSGGPVTLAPICRAFGSGAVITCFYDSGLSWLGFEHPTFRLQGERFNRLRHRRGFICT